MVVERRRGVKRDQAEETAPITDKEAHTALAAFSAMAKRRGHPAQLNLGDCFAYDKGEECSGDVAV